MVKRTEKSEKGNLKMTQKCKNCGHESKEHVFPVFPKDEVGWCIGNKHLCKCEKFIAMEDVPTIMGGGCPEYQKEQKGCPHGINHKGTCEEFEEKYNFEKQKGCGRCKHIDWVKSEIHIKPISCSPAVRRLQVYDNPERDGSKSSEVKHKRISVDKGSSGDNHSPKNKDISKDTPEEIDGSHVETPRHKTESSGNNSPLSHENRDTPEAECKTAVSSGDNHTSSRTELKDSGREGTPEGVSKNNSSGNQSLSDEMVSLGNGKDYPYYNRSYYYPEGKVKEFVKKWENSLTPDDYPIDCIKKLRKLAGSKLMEERG